MMYISWNIHILCLEKVLRKTHLNDPEWEVNNQEDGREEERLKRCEIMDNIKLEKRQTPIEQGSSESDSINSFVPPRGRVTLRKGCTKKTRRQQCHSSTNYSKQKAHTVDATSRRKWRPTGSSIIWIEWMKNGGSLCDRWMKCKMQQKR